jgi:hypothetical protein
MVLYITIYLCDGQELAVQISRVLPESLSPTPNSGTENSSLSKKFSQAGLGLFGRLRVIDAVCDFKLMTVDPLSLARVACDEEWK